MGSPEQAPASDLRIFLNYRRDDTADAAGRLYDALANRFGEERVFMDIDTIEPGVDFEEVVHEAVDSCDVVIAVIGRQWLTITDAKGRRRVDKPDDFVRMELEAAFARNVRVLPVLVQGVQMPGSEELPEGLKKLARRNALEMTHARWSYDLGRLTRTLERLAEEKSQRDRVSGEREREAAQRTAAERETAVRRGAKLPPSGWYPDPEDKGQMRAWDGAHWTDERKPAPLSSATEAAPRKSGSQGKASWTVQARRSLWILWPILSFGLLAVVGFALAGRRVGRSNLTWVGAAYSLIGVMTLAVASSNDSAFAAVLFTLNWLASGTHALIFNRRHLKTGSAEAGRQRRSP